MLRHSVHCVIVGVWVHAGVDAVGKGAVNISIDLLNLSIHELSATKMLWCSALILSSSLDVLV